MAGLELIVGLGTSMALELVKLLPRTAATGWLVDSASSFTVTRISNLFISRLKEGSPFRNQHLQRSLRLAYLQALQCVATECGLRGPHRVLSELKDWLGVLGHAISYEKKELEKGEVVPLHSALLDNLPVVLQPEVGDLDSLSADLEKALLTELRRELTLTKSEANAKAMLFAQKFYTYKQREGLAPDMVPDEFWEMIRDGWHSSTKVAEAANPSRSAAGEGHVRWIDLIRAYFAKALNENEEMRHLFFSEIMCRLALKQPTAPEQGLSSAFNELVGQQARMVEGYLIEIKEYLTRMRESFEQGFAEQEGGFVKLGAQVSVSHDSLANEIRGIQNLLGGQHAQVVQGLMTLIDSSQRVDAHSERIESEVRRLADQLQGLLKEAQTASGNEPGEEEETAIQQAYLSWLERQLRFIPEEIAIKGHRIELPLEQVYVSVRGYPGTTGEIQQADVLRSENDSHQGPTVLDERDRKLQFAAAWESAVDLGRAFSSNQCSIILGDPGSGKTTLVRWLTLAFAKAMLNGEAEVRVRAHTLDAHALRSNELVSLGKTRVPILLRVADLVEEFNRRDRKATLDELLGCGTSYGFPVYQDRARRRGDRVPVEQLTAFLRKQVKHNRAVLFLDGLDEIANPGDRKEVVALIHDLIDLYFSDDSDDGDSSPTEGNQLVVTSRIIGYELHPLRDSVSRFTVERLSERAVIAFSHSWHAACIPKLSASQEADAAAIAEASNGFLEQILDPERPALRELASNPLMLSLLCIINFENNGGLPGSRSQVYKLIVERGLNALFIERRKTSQSAQPEILKGRVHRLMEDIAMHMHATTSKGLLSTRELRGVIEQLMAGDELLTQMLGSPDEAYRMVIQAVGLLAERGGGQYGFRHQTVQEYLAGRVLIRNLDTAASRLLNHCSDSRWREAIVLGLSVLAESATTSAFLNVCDSLLEKRDELVPAGAILLVQVVKERVELPTGLIARTIGVLLQSYTECLASPALSSYASFVESTVAYLLTAEGISDEWRAEVEGAILDYVGDGSVTKIRSLAQLIHKESLFLARFVEPLIEACRHDGSRFGWVINHALEAMLTAMNAGVTHLRPVEQEDCRSLQGETLATLHDPQVIESIRYTGFSKHLGRERSTFVLTSAVLPMQDALERSPALQNRLTNDVRWMQLIWALYGGLGNYDTPGLRRELLDGKSKIGSAIIDDAVEGRIAAYLDEVVQVRLEKAAEVKTVFDPKLIFRDSPLTPLLVKALREGVAVAELIPQLDALWNAPTSLKCRQLAAAFRTQLAGRSLGETEAEDVLLCDVLVALFILSPANAPLRRAASMTEPQQRAWSLFNEEVDRLKHMQADVLLRGKKTLNELINLNLPDPRLISPTLSNIAHLLQRHGGETLQSLGLLSTVSASDLSVSEHAAILAQQWRYLLRPDQDDRGYNLVVSLDVAGKSFSLPAERLLASFALCAEFAVEQGWDRQSLCPFEYSPNDPVKTALCGIIFLVLLPTDCKPLTAWALRWLIPRLPDPDLLPLACWAGADLSERLGTFALTETLGKSVEGLTAELAVNANAIANPLIRFITGRVFRRTGNTEITGKSLLESALAIPDADTRFMCLQLALIEDAPAIYTEQGFTATRTALRAHGNREEENLLSLIFAAGIPNTGVEIQTLRREEVSWQTILSSGALSSQTHAPDFNPSRSETIEWLENAVTTQLSVEEVAVVAMFGLGLRLEESQAQQTQRPTEKAHDRWLRIIAGEGDDAEARSVIREGLATGLTMTTTGAERLKSLLEEGGEVPLLHTLLPLIDKCDPAVLPLLREWVTRGSEELVRRWAAVMLVDNGVWSPELIDALIEVMQDPNAVLRNRAAMVVEGMRYYSRVARASSFQLKPLLRLGEYAWKPEASTAYVGNAIGWGIMSILFDSPAHVYACLDLIQAGAEDAGAATNLLSCMQMVTPSVWTTCLDLITETDSTEIRHTLLRTLLKVVTYGATKRSAELARRSIQVFRWVAESATDPRLLFVAFDAWGRAAEGQDVEVLLKGATEAGLRQQYYLRALALNADSASPTFSRRLQDDDRLRAELKQLLRSGSEPVAEAAGELFLRAGVSPLEVASSMANTGVFLNACFASVDHYIYNQNVKELVRRLAAAIQKIAGDEIEARGFDDDNIFVQALAMLDRLFGEEDAFTFARRSAPNKYISNLLALCATVAELSPDLYRRTVREKFSAGFAGKLAAAVAREEWFVARQAAFLLLILTRTLSSQVAKALIPITQDVCMVQTMAFANIDRVREIDSQSFRELARLLESNSTNVAYFALRLIVAIVGSDDLSPETRETYRKRAVEMLSAVAMKMSPLILVSFLETDEDSGSARVRHVGFLRDLIQEALLKLSSAHLVTENKLRATATSVTFIRFRNKPSDQLFDLRICDRVFTDPVVNQVNWLKTDFNCILPAQLQNALNDLAAVSRKNGVSCAELIDEASRFEA